jgi:hypothetical protein
MHWLQEQMGQRAENAIAEIAVWSPRSDVDGAGRGVEGGDEAKGNGVGGGHGIRLALCLYRTSIHEMEQRCFVSLSAH